MTRYPTVPIPIPSRVYYGWVVVAAAFIVHMSTVGLGPSTFSFFMADMGSDLGMSRSALSLALTFRLVVSGMWGPFLGMLLDRLGPRWLGVGAGVLGAISVSALGFVDHLWTLYLLFALGGLGGIGGPGSNIITMVPVAKWFAAQRGRAMAIATIGLPAGAVSSALVAGLMIDSFGWRATWVIYGAVMAIVAVPVAFLFLRGAPEDLGLQSPSTSEGDASATGESRRHSERDWTLGEAVRTRMFWQVTLAMAMFGFMLSGVIVHRVSFWEDVGISSGVLAFGIASDPAMLLLSAVPFGVVGERLAPRYLGLIGGLGLACGVLPMVFTNGEAYTIFLSSMVWGLAAGAFMAVINLIWPSYFGRGHLGSIRGLATPLQVAAVGVGAPVYGYLFDSGVDPSIIWGITAAIAAGSGLLLFLSGPPAAPDPAAYRRA